MDRIAIPAAEYRMQAQNEMWLTLASRLNLLKASRLAGCRQYFSSWSDSNGHTFYRGTLCQQRDVCFTCSWVYNQELTSDTLELYRLLSNATKSKMEFGEATFTLPPSAQRLVGNEHLGVLRRAAFETVRETFSEEGRLVLGAVGSTHHWHTERPLRGWFPHAELTVLELAYEKDKDRFVPLDLFLKGEKLEQLNKLWRMKFIESFGDVKTPRFDTFWHYGSGYATAEHRFEYQFRRPVLETFQAVSKLRSPSRVNVNWVRRMLIRPKNEKRHQWYGYLSDGIKTRYLQKLGISIDRRDVRDRERRRTYCPDCDNELVCIGFGTPFEEVKKEPGSRILVFRSQTRGRR